MFPSIPGSRRNRSDEPPDPTAAGLDSGRFTEQQLLMLFEMISWWMNRRALQTYEDLTASLIGGVDLRGTVRTIGTTTTEIDFPAGTIICPNEVGRSHTYIVMAYGQTTDDTTAYAMTGLVTFLGYGNEEYYSRYATTGRAPDDHTAEVRSGVDLATDLPIIQIRGIADTTIDWTVEVLKLES